MRLIGLNGLKRSGKDTTYQMIQDLLPSAHVQRVAFADKLKLIAARALGFDRSDEELIALMDSMKESSNILVNYDETAMPPLLHDWFTLHSLTGREYLQHMGEHGRNVFGDTFWIDQVLPPLPLASSLEWRYPGVDILCVTDVRYENEAERIFHLGGELWRIERPGIESDGHATEQPLREVTHVIHNNSDLDELRKSVWVALDS